MMNAEDKYKVVIVDDERTAIDALRRELGAYQELEIKGTANNGAKGKKMIMELRPDLLFLDVELPDVLGLNLLSEMRDEFLPDDPGVYPLLQERNRQQSGLVGTEQLQASVGRRRV